MSIVTSADGTTIGFTKAGQGPPLILVDGALSCRSHGPAEKLATQLTGTFTVYSYDRRGRGESGDTAPYAVEREIEDLAALIAVAGGPVFVYGMSAGAALSLEAAKSIPAIAKLAVYEPPFIVDDSRPALTDDLVDQLNNLIAEGRRSEAVRLFLGFGGVPGFVTSIMSITSVWTKLKAMAPTISYEITLLRDHQRGTPLDPAEWSHVKVQTLVAAGGKSPEWMTNAARQLASVLPAAQHHTLPGQTHEVKPQVMAPILTKFFTTNTPQPHP